MTQEPHYFPMGGGVDFVSPAMSKNEGRAIASANYEPRPEGYKRLHGIERYDGQPQPHLATYYVLNFDAGSAAVSEGDTVTGVTSSATGKALIDGVVTSGTYGGGDAVGYLVIAEITGTFQDNENLQVSAATKCVSNGTATAKGADNDTDNATWLQDAIETRRALIGTVTGSGKIRGVWRYNNVSYVFRDNAGATAVNMWKSTASGWSQCDLGETLTFTSGGTSAIAEEDTVTGDASGATATVKRVIVDSGSWAGGDAAGRLIVYSVVGTFQAENLEVSATNLATIAADAVPNTFAAGGRFEFVNKNFYGSTGTRRMYGVDGVSTGFEWDGSVFVPILTGMTTDTPTHLIEHKKHLFFMFAGGSVQHSGVGAPYAWSVITGASEIGIGDEGTGFISVSGTLLIYAENSTHVLYGNDSTDWALDILSDEAGAYSRTIQNVGGRLVHMDAAGVRDLSATQKYGDFSLGNFSVLVDPWIKARKAAGATITATTRSKTKNQWRIFYSTNVGLIMDMTTGKPQFLPIDYGMPVECACAVEDSDGTEWLLFGSTDGYVYRADVGTSLDGSVMSSYIRLAFNHIKSPRHEKRFHSCEVEGDFAPNTSLSIAADYGYGNPDSASQVESDINVAGGGGFWDEAVWDEFYWSSQAIGQGRADLDGIGENISLVFASTATYEDPHTLHGATINYSFRKLKK